MITSEATHAGRRETMIQNLRAGGLRNEHILSIMGQIPRHLFVEQALQERAYEDDATPIGMGQTISKPSTVARMTEMAELTGTETALEIGTGSGYQAAVLSPLVNQLYTVERINEFSNRARKLFNNLGLTNVVCMVGNGATGYKKFAPYDVIMVTACGASLPKTLALQLADGGRMVVPVQEGSGQRIHLVRRQGERFVVTRKEYCQFVPLIDRCPSMRHEQHNVAAMSC